MPPLSSASLVRDAQSITRTPNTFDLTVSTGEMDFVCLRRHTTREGNLRFSQICGLKEHCDLILLHGRNDFPEKFKIC